MSEDNSVTVVIERAYAHAPQKVWRAITQPHLIEAWLMKNDFALSLGHRFNLRGDWGGVLDCEVLEIKPGEKLSYRWDYVHDDAAFNLRSVVTFILTPTEGGTHLRVEQAGFRKAQTQASGGARHGWKSFLDKLAGVLDAG